MNEWMNEWVMCWAIGAYDTRWRVKIDSTYMYSKYYRNVLLSQKLLSVTREISGEFVIFLQDRAPAQQAYFDISLV